MSKKSKDLLLPITDVDERGAIKESNLTEESTKTSFAKLTDGLGGLAKTIRNGNKHIGGSVSYAIPSTIAFPFNIAQNLAQKREFRNQADYDKWRGVFLIVALSDVFSFGVEIRTEVLRRNNSDSNFNFNHHLFKSFNIEQQYEMERIVVFSRNGYPFAYAHREVGICPYSYIDERALLDVDWYDMVTHKWKNARSVNSGYPEASDPGPLYTLFSGATQNLLLAQSLCNHINQITSVAQASQHPLNRTPFNEMQNDIMNLFSKWENNDKFLERVSLNRAKTTSDGTVHDGDINIINAALRPLQISDELIKTICQNPIMKRCYLSG